VSIVRIGLAEKKKYGDGYDAIFKKGAKKPAAKVAPAAATKKAAPAKKPAAAKKATAKKK
jgi:ribosomal protein L12E/L44/L45/RPP1/RPP2